MCKSYSFFDNDLLTVQLWERLLATLNRLRSPGVIIDLRDNGGGSGFLADQMAAYFFEEPFELGNAAQYNPELDDFYFDPRTVERYYLPPADLRYDGPLAVIVGPKCSSACEFFAYDLSLEGPRHRHRPLSKRGSWRQHLATVDARAYRLSIHQWPRRRYGGQHPH